MYVCQTVEHGYVHTLLRVTLHVLGGERVSALIHRTGEEGEEEGETTATSCHIPIDTPPDLHTGSNSDPTSRLPGALPGSSLAPAPATSRLWYKEFLQLIGYRDTQRLEEYCERVWCSEKRRRKTKLRYTQPLGRGERRARGRGEPHRSPRHTMDT